MFNCGRDEFSIVELFFNCGTDTPVSCAPLCFPAAVYVDGSESFAA